MIINQKDQDSKAKNKLTSKKKVVKTLKKKYSLNNKLIKMKINKFLKIGMIKKTNSINKMKKLMIIIKLPVTQINK